MLPVSPALVEEVGGLTPSLFNLPDQASLDTLVSRFVIRADAWMQGHMLNNYNLLTPPWAPILQEEGQIYLTLARLQDVLKNLKVTGTHYAYISEESPAYQTMIETNWDEKAMAALDLWVTVEVGGTRAFQLPQFLITPGLGPAEKQFDPTFADMSSQYSEELDFARGIDNPDIGTLRR